MKVSSEEDDYNRVLSKGMRVKEEIYIITIIRMVYYFLLGGEGAFERIEEIMLVYDIMKVF